MKIRRNTSCVFILLDPHFLLYSSLPHYFLFNHPTSPSFYIHSPSLTNFTIYFPIPSFQLPPLSFYFSSLPFNYPSLPSLSLSLYQCTNFPSLLFLLHIFLLYMILSVSIALSLHWL